MGCLKNAQKFLQPMIAKQKNITIQRKPHRGQGRGTQ